MTDRRRCGDCQLCCKLLPVVELNKAAGERCKHQKFNKGCLVYHRPAAGFPACCGFWNCAWLGGGYGTEDLRRPDRVHYVIDIMPDFVTVVPNEGDEPIRIPVVQVWIDPAYPDAHRDPGLRSYLAFRAEREGCAALIRSNAQDAFVLAAPRFSPEGKWQEQHASSIEKTHSLAEVAQHFGLKMEIGQ